MARLILFDKFAGNVGRGLIPLHTATIRAYLSNTTPDLINDQYRSDLAEISAGFGYTAGGVTLGSVTWQEEAGSPQGVWALDSANFQWDASGGSIGPARYVVLYALGSGSPNEFLIGYVDLGSAQTITDGNSLIGTVDEGWLEAVAVNA
jgi:hypothetical protein